MIIYEDERFYILDTGSSNGTFVNNIRLSKTGEESKMTEVFTGDIIRFGSDIVDKVKISNYFFQMTFKMAKILNDIMIVERYAFNASKIVYRDEISCGSWDLNLGPRRYQSHTDTHNELKRGKL